MKGRLTLIALGVITVYSGLLFRFYNLQINKGDYYSARAESQFRSSGLLEPRRGNIYFSDKNGNSIPAAINKDYPSIYAVPKEIQDAKNSAAILSKILSVSESQILKSLLKTNDLYELLLVKATVEQVEAVRLAAIAGIYIADDTLRFYPFGKLSAHLLGFVGPSDKDDLLRGRYGIEAAFDSELHGVSGVTEEDKIIRPKSGKDISLTIDRAIQARAEEILSGVIKEYEAVSGTVIVQEPATGKILALGNYPAYDPNSYSEYAVKSFLNPAIEAVYEPGSIIKVLTMAAGIDSGKITPDTTYYDTGSVTINGRTIKNWDFEKKGAHGKVTMAEGIEQSINTAMVFAEKKTGHVAFLNYLEKFGLEEETSIELPGEVSGSLRPLKKNARDINFATASFGQGISTTPLQVLRAIGSIANGGVMMNPYIIEGTEPRMVRRVVSKEAADQVTAIMVSAVAKAQVAQIPNYRIAGKTGTAQVPDFGRGGYTDDVINTYVGFAPASSPKFIVLIKIDKPRGAPLAGLTVVPAFRELTHFVLNYYNIPPDDLGN